MKARIVTTKFLAKNEIDVPNLVAFIHQIQSLGYQLSGHTPYPDSPRRPELWGQPTFTGLVGPMWDGDWLRYEDHDAHDILST